MGPRRVLWLAKGLGRGGTEQRLVRALPLIDRSRFEVEVAYLLPWKDALVPTLGQYGVQTHCLDGRRALDVRWVRRLRKLVAERNYDLVHTLMPYPAVLARVSLPGRVIIHTEPNVWSGYRRMTAWANAVTYRRNAAVIAVSDAVAASIHPPLPGWPMPSVEVVMHGIDPSEVRRGPAARAEGRRRLGYGADELVVGVVASLTPKKDHRTLLSAFAQVTAEQPAARLAVIGTGRLDEELHRFADGLGISDVVQFVGSRTDVLELLPGLDAIALSSRHEGLPIALVEALATGIPCVATAVGGVPEVVQHGEQGFLVEPGDVRGLAQSLIKLLGDDDLRREMAASAAQRGAELDLPSAIERTQSIYERVLAGR